MPALLIVLACFAIPLWRLVMFALHDDLYSYVLLLPFVSWYLVRTKPPQALAASKPLRPLGVILILAGAAVGVGYLMKGAGFTTAYAEDYLFVNILAFYLCFLGVNFLFLGRATLRALAFPVGMLAFMIPMSLAMRTSLETFLQYGSAYCADGMFRLAGTTFFREGLLFHLPRINILVAPECSGIHASWILLITSLLAGYLFLDTMWRRTLLAVLVLPLALVRNGFRVFTLGELSIHISPAVMDSPIHHQGGPLFFGIFIVPFFLLLIWLRRSERPRAKTETQKN